MEQINWFNETVAAAFGLGCAAGYSFAMKTALKVAMERLQERDNIIQELKDRIKQLEALLHQRRSSDPLNDKNGASLPASA